MADLQKSDKTCSICDMEFGTLYSKNRHLKNIHKIETTSIPKKSNIICPLCTEKKIYSGTYKKLETHLELEHKKKLEVETLNFNNQENYQHWFESQKLEMIYANQHSSTSKDCVKKHYFCNRSNTKGFESTACQRVEKTGGSIKIYGVCPSRIESTIFHTGQTVVRFWKTHVGHEIVLRNQHLSKRDKEDIVQKLSNGVTVDRIINDARKIESEKLERINLLNRKDISYLMRKHNIMKKKHENSMIAVNLKVKEWNENGKNYCFFFKQEGENHLVLNPKDFCLGFMNNEMEKKLNDFPKIICMDGTHCTNQKGMDLTIMLVKDDQNMGFPVAFFLSNRLDQIVQEVFINALKQKVKKNIQPDYFMSDDDPKYYNAWVKIMETKPRRLLCTWHVMKNWVIQGRSKIRNEQIKKSMKVDMKKILNETNIFEFEKKSLNYFEKLQTSEEHAFLNYLKKFYYQSTERKAMWAHCYRLNAGINTNMALESLNNILKTNQLKRKTNITIDRLLDELEILVDGKMWQRILKMERPHSNNYHDRIVIKAHKLAETLTEKNDMEILEVGFGEFLVKSSKGEKFYKVCLNVLCEIQCRTSYCRSCKVCIHRYSCECPENAIRNNLCKHIHLVCLYEQRSGSESVLGEVAIKLSKEKPSGIAAANSREIEDFIMERRSENSNGNTLSLESTREAKHEAVTNYLRSLNDDEFDRCVAKIMVKGQVGNACKRKMAKQEFFPSKKRN